MVLPVYVYGMSVLRKITQDIPEDFEGLDQLIEDMFDTMKASDGVGLAGPQVGKNLRIFIVDASDVADEHDEQGLKDFRKVFINPYIMETSGKPWPFEEGCLSLPNIREEVIRPEKVKIEYYDENWVLKEEEYDGFKARVIQHEYDHLDGKLFVDHISPIRRKLLGARLNSISKGRVDCDYRIIFPKK